MSDQLAIVIAAAQAAARKEVAAAPVIRYLPATVESYDAASATAAVLLDGDPAGGAVGADVIAAGFVPAAGQRVMCVRQPPSSLLVVGAIGTAGWVAFTPTLTASVSDPDLGTDPVVQGRWRLDAGVVAWQAAIVFGTGSSPGSGIYNVTLPMPATAFLAGIINALCGTVQMTDASANIAHLGVVHSDGAMVAHGAANVTDAVPWAWADGDALLFGGIYLV